METESTEYKEKKKPEKKSGERKITLDKDSIQYNAQELQQEQKVNTSPLQLNSQNLHFFVRNGKNNCSSKITGNTVLEKDKKAVTDVTIKLFFGRESDVPVYKTNSDKNGNFSIEDIPPGYYTLVAEYGDRFRYKSQYIKVFSGNNIFHAVSLIEMISNKK